MIRKFAFAVATLAALGTASIFATTSPAIAKGMHGHGHHGHFRGLRVYVGDYVDYDDCIKRVWRVNRFGEPVLRVINVCD